MSNNRSSGRCKVYLCCTSLQPGNCINDAINSFSKGNSWAQHWLLVFDYGQNDVLICDADNHGGELTGRTYWKKRAALENYEKKIYLGKRNIPEERIYSLVRKRGDSGQYHYTDNNCQKWAQDLLRELDIEMPADEVDARTVVTNYIQPAAFAGGTVVGVCGIGVLIYMSCRNKRE
ncbi:uncharacterized protein LOC119390638 [Rhipicephalus sanguineus]|uniref:uncharacterized protein LOC119390638 n=1 Tax=Rhipicephalus sanguineus TaxID=34632 RepID=UPI001894C0D7|nr:uncharacterized protein LOC119390638 [Rhipicephalus sanguineus]XP_037514175.1 uncharacterized protein LOC119390638 [Rhipicephalus sanguineus]